MRVQEREREREGMKREVEERIEKMDEDGRNRRENRIVGESKFRRV